MANQYRGLDINTLKEILSAIKEQLSAVEVYNKMQKVRINFNGARVPYFESNALQNLKKRKRIIEDVIREKDQMHYGGRKRVTRKKKSIHKKR